MSQSFFEGLKVVEVADRRNQFAGKLLSDSGARVLQVEPLAGSPGRWCGPFVGDKPNPDKCLDYWYYNTGKLSVCIDLERPRGQDLLRGLVAQADVLLESTLPGQMHRWQLDYNSLDKASQERLIYASITDFGQDGPWKDYLANDVSHLALGGQMGASGYSDPTAPPIGGQGHQAWHIAGALCLQAITVALIERMGSGRGQYIDCSIHDCCSICTEGSVPSWIYASQVPYRHPRETDQGAGIVRRPSTLQRCADGVYINTSGSGAEMPQHLWLNLLRFMKELGVAEGLEDPKYMDEAFRFERWRNGPEIQEGIARLVAKLPAEEAMRRGQAYELTWAVARAPEENYDEKHWNERGFFVPVEHPGLPQPVRYPRGPFLCEDYPIQSRHRAPDLGEHTATVLQEWLGLSKKEIQALKRSEVIK